jgi:hypothetical protein
MTEFTLRERSTTTRHVTVFIPYPDEESEGGGWSYTATADSDSIYIDFMGNFRLKHLPALIQLLELAAKEDTTRNEEFGSPSFDFTTYEKDEAELFESDAEERKLPVIGLVPEDSWIANGVSVDREQRSLSTITLMRASNRYIALEIGHPKLSFNAHELEATTALLKEFVLMEQK